VPENSLTPINGWLHILMTGWFNHVKGALTAVTTEITWTYANLSLSFSSSLYVCWTHVAVVTNNTTVYPMNDSKRSKKSDS
jgi:hypothetical protein